MGVGGSWGAAGSLQPIGSSNDRARPRRMRPCIDPLLLYCRREQMPSVLTRRNRFAHPAAWGDRSMVRASLGKGYLVRRVQEAPTVPCPCGESTRPLTRAETPVCNLHVTFIRDSAKHYHKQCTEVYYILDGCGK